MHVYDHIDNWQIALGVLMLKSGGSSVTVFPDTIFLFTWVHVREGFFFFFLKRKFLAFMSETQKFRMNNFDSFMTTGPWVL